MRNHPTALEAHFDLLITAPVIHTLDPELPKATAIGIQEGKITWIGDAADTDPSDADRHFDVPEGCVTPGLIDSHIHPIMGLDITRGADLSGVRSLEELNYALTKHITYGHSDADNWVLGWGLDPGIVSNRNLSAIDLDDIVFERPLFIRLFDGHSAVVNTAAGRLSGLTGSEEFASSAEVETDVDGQVTGFLKEWEAMALVLKHIPAQEFDQRLEAFLDVINGMADAGLTGGQVLDWTDGMLDLVRAAEEQGDLPIKILFSPWLMPADREDRFSQLIELQGQHGARWAVDGVKLMIDGTIDNGTAWLEVPDVNGESTGPLWLDPHAFTEALHRLDSQDIRTTTHAIGDEAVRFVLRAIATSPGSTVGTSVVRHRVEHIETIPDELIDQFAVLNVAASMQPTHCTLFCSADRSDNWSQRLGDERVDQAWRLHSLRNAGVTVAVGSDWPIAPYHPLRIIADGQLRREAGEPSQQPIVPDEALTALQLLEGYTTHQAKSWGRTEAGAIRIGQPADLSIFGADILEVDPDHLPEVSVVATVVDGVVRQTRKSQ